MTRLKTMQSSHIIYNILKYLLFEYYYFYNCYFFLFIKFNQYHVDTCQT